MCTIIILFAVDYNVAVVVTVFVVIVIVMMMYAACFSCCTCTQPAKLLHKFALQGGRRSPDPDLVQDHDQVGTPMAGIVLGYENRPHD